MCGFQQPAGETWRIREAGLIAMTTSATIPAASATVASPAPGFVAALLPGTAATDAHGKRVIGVLPGEGIGPEIIDASIRLLAAIESVTGLTFELRYGGKIGVDAVRESGQALTPAVTGFCADVFSAGGAIFCGPGGGRFVYDLRATFDLFCKLVPLQPLPALAGTGVLVPGAVRDVDILLIRENTGGLYVGETGTEVTDGGTRAWHRFHYDEDEVDRILRLAIRAARLRRGQLCVVTKPAGVPGISGLWRSRAEALGRDAGIDLRILEIDNACYQIVADARSFDVIVAPNMFGDVLADGASVLLGSRGMSYSANYSPGGCAVYQTGHGAAYDLAGTDRANPVGQIQSLAMMLRESFGLPDIAQALVDATNAVLAAGVRTPDVLAAGCRSVGTRALASHIEAALLPRLVALGQPARATRSAMAAGQA
jgi:3-isopropylmalate dehydrogenase